MEKKKMSFYDLQKKKKFMTDQYKTVTRSGRVFAVAKNPAGKECWRIMGRAKK